MNRKNGYGRNIRGARKIDVIARAVRSATGWEGMGDCRPKDEDTICRDGAHAGGDHRQ